MEEHHASLADDFADRDSAADGLRARGFAHRRTSSTRRARTGYFGTCLTTHSSICTNQCGSGCRAAYICANTSAW
jgi:hypothetical protein